MPESFAAPIGLPQLRTICDEHDDGRRNWFVTLAYRDLSQQTAAYTHALDVHDERGLAAEREPAVDTVEEAKARFEALYEAAEPTRHVPDRTGRVIAPLRVLARRPRPENRTSSQRAAAPVGDLMEELTGLRRPPIPRGPRTPKQPLNANFCTFAAWSSLTLGRDIRNIRLPRRFDRLSGDAARRALTNLVVEARRTHRMELAQLLGLGQRVVLWEVGAVLHAMFMGSAVLDNLASVRDLDFSDVADTRHFTDHAMHESEEVISQWLAMAVTPRGADGLRQLRTKDLTYGAASYHLARCAARQAHAAQASSDPDEQAKVPALWKWVAELILRGNLLIGAYEQRKVDQLLRYPVEDFASEFILERSGLDARERAGTGRWHRRFERRVRSQLDEHAPRIWGRAFTDQVLVLWAGDELLRLGRDLPPPPGSVSFFPPDLEELHDGWLFLLWRQYDHSYGDGHGTQSRIWSVFPDRMNYIVNFMRSRAQAPGLWQDPFEGWENKLLRIGQTPRSQDDPSA